MIRVRFMRYLVVGASSYVIEMGSLYVLSRTFGLSNLAAVAISFWVGFIVAFVLQKWIAFENHEKTAHIVTKQLAAYGTLAAWNYGFTLAVVAVFSPVASVFIIRTVAIVIISLWNFSIYRIIFKRTISPNEYL